MSCTKQDIEPVFDIKETVLKEEPTPNRAFDNITYYANQHVQSRVYYISDESMEQDRCFYTKLPVRMY